MIRTINYGYEIDFCEDFPCGNGSNILNVSLCSLPSSAKLWDSAFDNVGFELPLPP